MKKLLLFSSVFSAALTLFSGSAMAQQVTVSIGITVAPTDIAMDIQAEPDVEVNRFQFCHEAVVVGGFGYYEPVCIRKLGVIDPLFIRIRDACFVDPYGYREDCINNPSYHFWSWVHYDYRLHPENWVGFHDAYGPRLVVWDRAHPDTLVRIRAREVIIRGGGPGGGRVRPVCNRRGECHPPELSYVDTQNSTVNGTLNKRIFGNDLADEQGGPNLSSSLLAN